MDNNRYQGHPETRSRCPVHTRSRPIATTKLLQRDETVRFPPLFTDGELTTRLHRGWPTRPGIRVGGTNPCGPSPVTMCPTGEEDYTGEHTA